MDVQSIKNYTEDFKPIFEMLSKKEQPVKATTVDSIVSSSHLSRAQVIDLFKKLAEAGAGEFRMGRRGQPTRIEWAYNLSDVGKLALGEADEIKPLYADEGRKGPRSMPSVPHKRGRPVGSKNKTSELNDHVYLLRNDVKVHFKLPKDLNQNEAKRLAEFVQTLPQ